MLRKGGNKKKKLKGIEYSLELNFGREQVVEEPEVRPIIWG
jgi:hypothetical protein